MVGLHKFLVPNVEKTLMMKEFLSKKRSTN
jgi:hypothetical protein